MERSHGFMSLFVLFLVFSLSSMNSITVKINKENNFRNDFNHNIDYNDIKSARSQASNFSGPTDLQHFVGKCFIYSSDKYDYRVCPFNNVTQHERIWRSDAYNGVIGIWKEWMLSNNSFDSLMFYNGDDCGEGVERSAQMIWICNRDISESNDRVVNITEPNKCFYRIMFASDFGCENKYIYPHLSEEYKEKWNQIESNYFYEFVTQFGYESALHDLFVESGIVLNQSYVNSEDNELNFETKDKCLEKYILLQNQNQNLMKRIEFLENESKNKSF